MRPAPAPTRPDDAGSDEEVTLRGGSSNLMRWKLKAVEVFVVGYGVMLSLNGTKSLKLDLARNYLLARPFC